MTKLTSKAMHSEIISGDDHQRANYLIKAVITENKVWILKDQHGCVMLNTEEEDCVPVWPDQDSASNWATEEWQHCQPESISLTTWFQRWSPGLADDELSLVLFPSKEGYGVVYYPDEFEQALKTKMKKSVSSRTE